MGTVRSRRPASGPRTWSEAVDPFLAERDLSANSVRAYRMTLDKIGRALDPVTLADLQPTYVAVALAAATGTWHRRPGTETWPA